MLYPKHTTLLMGKSQELPQRVQHAQSFTLVLLLAHFHIIFSKYVLCESCDMMKANSWKRQVNFFG
jgi:hypothetical protein